MLCELLQGQFAFSDNLLGDLALLSLDRARARGDDLDDLLPLDRGFHDRGQAAQLGAVNIVDELLVDALSSRQVVLVDFQGNRSLGGFDDCLGLGSVLLADLDLNFAALDRRTSFDTFVFKILVNCCSGLAGLRVFQVLVNRLVQVALDGLRQSGGIHRIFRGGRACAVGLA